jgi:hypothetical protein
MWAGRVPRVTNQEPIDTPPNSACDELDGSPRNQVTRGDHDLRQDTLQRDHLCARAAPDGMRPRCGGASRRVHTWHVRRLTDLPVAGRSLVIELRVRRLAARAQRVRSARSASTFRSWRCATPGARCA